MAGRAIAAKNPGGIARKARAKSFMVKPDTGWLHDDRALNAGRGVYVRYPATFIGTVRCDKSIRQLPIDDQTKLARSAIACIADAAIPKSVELSGSSYDFGQDSRGAVPVMMNISSKGILIAPEAYEGGADDEIGIIDFKEMRLVSLAAGGEDSFFNYVTYIAKDKSGVREAFAFDCGEVADDVLMTLGQAFNLAIAETEARKAARAKKKAAPPPRPARTKPAPAAAPAAAPAPHVVDYDTGNYTETNEAFALPAQVEAIYDSAVSNPAVVDATYDVANPEPAEAVYDTANPETVPAPPAPETLYDVANPAVAAVVTNADNEVDDIATELLNLMQAESSAIYESTEQFRENPLSPAGLVSALNKSGTLNKGGVPPPKLKSAASEEHPRPSWVYFKPASEPKKADLNALRAAAQAEDL